MIKDERQIEEIAERVFVRLNKSSAFTNRKMTDTPTDALQVANKHYVDRKALQMVVFAPNENTATGDGKFYAHIDERLDGLKLADVHALVATAGTTNNTGIQIANVTQAVDMLTTTITIDSGETGSDTAATAAVIDTANNQVTLNDIIRVDVDAVSDTPAKGLIVTLGFTING